MAGAAGRRRRRRFAEVAVANSEGFGITVESVTLDESSCYKFLRFRRTCKRLRVAASGPRDQVYSMPRRSLQCLFHHDGRLIHVLLD